MAVSISTRSLPGIGVCHEFTSAEGTRVGVVTRRNGVRDVVVYDRDDIDEARLDVELTEAEANALAELLGGPQLLGTLRDIDDTGGLRVQQLPVEARSRYAGRPLGETRARTRTGVSIVAVIRGQAVQPSPAPDFVLLAGDLVAVVGTEDAIDRLAGILTDG